ncbi:N-6 DNA methylase [Sphaerospermopsis sp. LEGE 08334]|uniref:N-6 DNA methylase n=1 Tax=Sphaerospermopsis sp. LEGE 08334 TaxID=1828651 RepID=UPI0028160B8A|nr:N-6 DNA methylase [Sphaerospermopsis sp. LEGE 08334]
MIKPKIGEKIYDGACGSAGFLCESYDYLRQGFGFAQPKGKLTTKQLEILQKKYFYRERKEKFSLCYWHHEYDFTWD